MVSLAKVMERTWLELFQDLIEAGLGKPLIGAALITLGALIFRGLGGVPKFIPEIVPVTAAFVSLILLVLGLLIFLRWIKNFL